MASQRLADLLRWRSETPYAGDQDWIFASKRMKGRQPLWPEAIERNYIRPAAERVKITKHIIWHMVRHTFSTLLRSVGTEFEAMQELLRHFSFPSTLDVYTQAIMPAKHAAQAAVLSLVLSSDKDGPALVAG